MSQRVDSLGSGYQTVDKKEAQMMANMVERWLGNPAVRQMLRFCTQRDICGRRIEIALKRYIGVRTDACLRCRVASMIVGRILDSFIRKGGFKRKIAEDNLRDFMFRKGMASVLEGLAEYGPVKPFTSYSPFLVVWNYTKACNLKCKHCYEHAHIKAPDELTTKERMELIDDMGRMGVTYVAMSGGEPLIDPDFFEAAGRLKKNEIAFSIATNGTLLTPEKARKLKEFDCRYVQISLDGATAKTHDWLRGNGMFDRAIQGIKNAVKEGLCVGIATTITSRNYDEAPRIIDLTEKLGAKIWMYYNFIPTGRGKDIADLDITPMKRENLLKLLSRETKKRKDRLSLLTTAPQYSRVSLQCGAGGSLSHFDRFSADASESIQFLAEFVGGCGCARLYFALEPNGDIEPCVFLPIKIGNIRKESLQEVWKNNEVLKKIRDRKSFWGFCGECKERNICGGCRARAYGYYGDVQGPDTGCIYNQKYWDELGNPMKEKAV